MANRRKAFHFDLDEDRLKSLYPLRSKTGYKGAWGKIQAFMEEHGFEHTQYSDFESIRGMSYMQAYKVLEVLQRNYPCFKECAKAATLTNIGERYDVLAFYAQTTKSGKGTPNEEQEPPMENQFQDRVTPSSDIAKPLDEQDVHTEPSRDMDTR